MDKKQRYKQDGSRPALLRGRLKNVSLRYRTAELHRIFGDPVPLRFDAKMEHVMIRLRDKYVKVRGHGVINEEEDRWESVHVERARYERNSVDELLNNPKPKIFDPDDIVTASEPFDVDEFLRTIYEGRNARTGDQPR